MDDLSNTPTLDDDTSNLRMIHIIENLCNKLRCSILANDLERVAKAHDLLTKFQHKEIFESILGPGEYFGDLEEDVADLTNLESQANISQALAKDTSPRIAEEWEEEEECSPRFLGSEADLPENMWHGYFRGYQMINEEVEFSIGENKKCIEISKTTSDEAVEAHLRSGISCFCIDLFVGSVYENQALVVRLRQTQLRISRELGFPVCTTLFAKLSPRLQYTGDLDPNLLVPPVLQKNDELILSVERVTSTCCNKDVIYVNATFLLYDVQYFDIICVGPDIQLMVKENKVSYLQCSVLIGGILKSRLPVLFPGRCHKFNVSVEELEDITFCKEIGINIIVSRIIGTQEYFDDLTKTLSLFKCERMRLWAALFVNETKESEDNYKWAVEGYDGFLLEFMPPPNPTRTEILRLRPATESFINRAYQLQKPTICDPMPLGLKQYLVGEEHYPHFFLYPEKYLFKSSDNRQSFNFFLLQDALGDPLPKQFLFKLPYYDMSLTGSDSLARAAVGSAFESRAALIIVLGVTGRMATKLAHFRPKAPIVFVTPMQSAASFVQVYHNVIMLYFIGKSGTPHRTLLYEQFLYGLAFAKQRKIINHRDDVLFVYRKTINTKYPDSYILYKYDTVHFAAHVKSILNHKM